MPVPQDFLSKTTANQVCYYSRLKVQAGRYLVVVAICFSLVGKVITSQKMRTLGAVYRPENDIVLRAKKQARRSPILSWEIVRKRERRTMLPVIVLKDQCLGRKLENCCCSETYDTRKKEAISSSVFMLHITN